MKSLIFMTTLLLAVGCSPQLPSTMKGNESVGPARTSVPTKTLDHITFDETFYQIKQDQKSARQLFHALDTEEVIEDISELSDMNGSDKQTSKNMERIVCKKRDDKYACAQKISRERLKSAEQEDEMIYRHLLLPVKTEHNVEYKMIGLIGCAHFGENRYRCDFN